MCESVRERAQPAHSLTARVHVFRAAGVGVVLAGEATAHRHKLALAGRIQAHDVGNPHRRRDDNLVVRRRLDGANWLRERVNVLPGVQLGELAAHRYDLGRRRSFG